VTPRIGGPDLEGEEAARDEVEFHIESRARRLMSEGWSEAGAWQEARRRFGDPDRVRAAVEREMKRRRWTMRIRGWLDGFGTDLRVGLRQWRRDPGTLLVAGLTLALGIGATTAIFSLVYGILLRPLPFPQPDRLVALWVDVTERGGPEREWWGYPNIHDVRQEVGAFHEVGIYTGWLPVLTGRGTPTQLSGSVVTAGTLAEVLGGEPVLGRLFLPEEDVAGGPNVVVVSHRFWQDVLGAHPDAVGETLVLNGTSFEVIGVLPAGFEAPIQAGSEIFGLAQVDAAAVADVRGNFSWRAIGRLAPQVTLEAAQAELTALATRLEGVYPEHNSGMTFTVAELRGDMVAQARTALVLVLAAVVLVLLLACVNVSNLLLARNATREGAFAVRAALGSGRGRVVRQLVVETGILAGVGGLVGLGLGVLGTRGLVALAPNGTPRVESIAVDVRVMGAAALATILVAVVTGLLPAFRAGRGDLRRALTSGGRGGPGSEGLHLRGGLVVVQVSLAVALLCTAGLLTRSLAQLRSVDLGFEPRGVLTFFLGLPGEAYRDRNTRADFLRTLEDRLGALPGVEGVGGVTALPLAGFDSDVDFRLEGAPEPEPGRQPTAWVRRVTPTYMETMGLRLLSGRGIQARDVPGSPPVVVINETLAQRYFPDMNPIGSRLNLGSGEDPLWFEIVGVVENIRNFDVRDDWRSAFYIANGQYPGGALFFALRVSEGLVPTSLTPAIRATLAEMDPNLAATAVTPMEEQVRAALGPDRFLAWLLGGFAALALTLAVVGLYGVVSYAVGQRMREVAVRMALGADAGSIHGRVLTRSLVPVGAGLLAGFGLAWAAGRFASSLLYQVASTDPMSYGGTAVLLVLTALVAAGIPAFRASRADPMTLLRDE
jgi:predicted permease